MRPSGGTPMSMVKAIWKDQVGSKVIAGAILTVLGAVVAWLKGWWPKVWAGIVYGWNWLALSSTHPNWLLILLWLSAAVVVFYIAARTLYGMGASANLADTWQSYRRDQFNGVVWQWRYSAGPHSSVENLIPLCPRCQCQLTRKDSDGYYYGNSYYALYCTHCARNVAEFKEDYLDTLRSIELLIGRNIRSGDWTKALGDERLAE